MARKIKFPMCKNRYCSDRGHVGKVGEEYCTACGRKYQAIQAQEVTSCPYCKRKLETYLTQEDYCPYCGAQLLKGKIAGHQHFFFTEPETITVTAEELTAAIKGGTSNTK